MKIINIMLSRSLGGIQQSFIDYAEALSREKLSVINVVSVASAVAKTIGPLAKSVSGRKVQEVLGAQEPNVLNVHEDLSTKTTPQFTAETDFHYSLLNISQYDIFSAIYLAYIIRKEKPDLVIAHGNRAIKFVNFFKPHMPIIGIAHNYGIKQLKRCDYIIALTKHMQEFLKKDGVSDNRIAVIPNMVRLPVLAIAHEPNESKILKIGSFGRFVKKKGFDIYLQALSILKKEGYKFQAFLGGGGPEESNLKKLCTSLGLDSAVTFSGWVDDKEIFFKNIDIFCLPSLHEPFGIIVLEAMAYLKPIIATKSEGPLEILTHNEDGLLCEINSPQDLAEKIAIMFKNANLREKFVQN